MCQTESKRQKESSLTASIFLEGLERRFSVIIWAQGLNLRSLILKDS